VANCRLVKGEFHAAGSPQRLTMATARALARMYGATANGGEIDGTRAPLDTSWAI